jgi:hypothetical protein
MLSIPALLLTAAWVVVVAVILALFGRTAGGAWSIAGTVARGVRDWAGSGPTSASGPRATSSPSRPSAPPTDPASAGAADATAETQDLGTRPT